MKIAPRDIERFVKNPDQKFHAILLYGPDEGLVCDRARNIGKTIAEDLADPFNVVDLTTDILSEDPARLSDEMGAMSMMGGRRLIRLRNTSEKATGAIESALNGNTNPDNILVIEAGDLKPSSKLRKLCEKLDNAAAIPCYVDDQQNLGRIIADAFTQENVQIDREALQALSSNLVGDRGVALQMVNKIITYIGEEKPMVTLETVQICTEDSSILYLDDLARAVASGDIANSSTLLERLLQEGFNAITILRSLENYFKRIAFVRAGIDAGGSLDACMKKLRPPVFFKVQKEFTSHVHIWPTQALKTVMQQLLDTEAECKTTGAATNLLCDRLVFRIAHMAHRKKSRRAA